MAKKDKLKNALKIWSNKGRWYMQLPDNVRLCPECGSIITIVDHNKELADNNEECDGMDFKIMYICKNTKVHNGEWFEVNEPVKNIVGVSTHDISSKLYDLLTQAVLSEFECEM